MGAKSAASGPSRCASRPSPSGPGKCPGFGVFRTPRDTPDSVGAVHSADSKPPRGLHGRRAPWGVRGLLSPQRRPRSAWTDCRPRNPGTPRSPWIAPDSIVSEMLRLNPETLRNAEPSSAPNDSAGSKPSCDFVASGSVSSDRHYLYASHDQDATSAIASDARGRAEKKRSMTIWLKGWDCSDRTCSSQSAFRAFCGQTKIESAESPALSSRAARRGVFSPFVILESGCLTKNRIYSEQVPVKSFP